MATCIDRDTWYILGECLHLQLRGSMEHVLSQYSEFTLSFPQHQTHRLPTPTEDGSTIGEFCFFLGFKQVHSLCPCPQRSDLSSHAL